MNRSEEDALHAVLQTDPQVSLFFFLSAALYQSFCTFPRKIEACILQSTEPISIVIQYTDPLDYEIWRREPQKIQAAIIMSLVHESNLARSRTRRSTDASGSHFLVNCKAVQV